MVNWALVLAALSLSSTAIAGEQVRYEPPPKWVRQAAIPDMPPNSDGAAVQILLLDEQSRLSSANNEFYAESATRVLTPQGLASAASISLSWSPDTETVSIHRLAIIRGNKTIDLLDGGKNVTVLRREHNLELAMLDGNLTATVQPEGLRVGDIIDIAVTYTRHDPVLKGHSQVIARLSYPGVIGHVRFRELWENTKPVVWRITDDLPRPTVSRLGDETELVVDRLNMAAPKAPLHAPQRFADVGLLQMSDFRSWAEVSALMAPLYVQASTLAPGSALRDEAAKIRAANRDPKARAEAALRLVQEKVHYVYLGMNLGGYVPADADVTWKRRFGDCKGKTALLLALLHELGVEAQPALVSTIEGDALAQRLPTLAFDHVMARAEIGGRVYWLDGTRSDDRDLDEIPVPDFRWVLPVQSADARLERLVPKSLNAPAFESIKQIDARAGYDAPASAHLEQIFRGDVAIAWHVGLSALGRGDSDRRLKEYWRGQTPWMSPKSVAFSYDDQHHALRLTADGQGKLDWTRNGQVRDFDIGDSNLGFNSSFTREPGPHADAPISVPYPEFNKWTVTIKLPGQGGGFRLLEAADVDMSVAGRHFMRRSRIEGGVISMVAQQESLASEFPYAQAEPASIALRELASHDVVVRGVGGTSMDALPAVEEESAAEPTDAAAFSRRGMSFLARKDYELAASDFTSAARLQPLEAKHYYNRGVVQFASRDDAAALSDFNMALRLNPKDGLAYAARAELRLAKGDTAPAWADYDQAVKVSPDDARIRERRAAAYERSGRYKEAIRDLDDLLARPQPSTRLALLNARCWAKAEWARELAGALEDCNSALALAPTSVAVLDSRALVELRMGRLDAAIADYDRVLQEAPHQPSSLFGRGMAKFARGDAAGGRADIAAAKAVAPSIPDRFARFGVKPPAS